MQITFSGFLPRQNYRQTFIVWLVATAMLGAWPSTVAAQLPQIRLSSLFPVGGQVGGQVGGTFDVVVTGGVDLDGATGLLFSDPAITAVPKTTAAAGEKAPEANTFTVTIAPHAQPGVCDVRVAGRFGVSNPRSFEISTRRELAETEPNDTIEHATPVELNSVINARSNTAGDVDMYRFHGQQGQRVLAECRGAGLDSRLLATIEAYDARGRRLGTGCTQAGPDPMLDVTLPADGDYVLKIFDSVYRGGNEYFYRLDLHNQPHLDFVLPPGGVAGSSGTYTLFGRNLPGGTAAGVDFNGRALETLAVQIAIPSDDTQLPSDVNFESFQAGNDSISYALDANGTRSNRVPIHFATAAVALEAEPNNTPDTAQKITVPAEVAGQFQSPGDIDYVQYAAKAQEVFWIEVYGHRDGSGADPYLTLEQIVADESGRETGAQLIATLDDIETNLFPDHFQTRSDDVSYRFVVPADGSYRISLRDRYFESRGDRGLTYRLSIRRERPDFRLVAVPLAPRSGENNNTAAPWPIGLRQGDRFAVRVLAFRRDGFDGSISLAVEGLPEGVSCLAPSLESGQVQTTLVFSSAENSIPAYAAVRVVGKAQIPTPDESGTSPPPVREVIRTARAGTIVWEGDAQRPALSRVARELGLCVINELAPLQVTTDAPRFDVNRDQTIELPVKLTKRNGFDNEVTLTLSGQPQEVQFETTPIAKGATEGTAKIVVPPNAPPGTYTLLLRARAQVSYTRNPAPDKPDADAAAATPPQDLTVVVPAAPIVLHIN